MTDKLTNKKTLVILLNVVLFTKCGDTAKENKTENLGPLNILFITADDMNYNSLGCYGSDVENISPNLDQLAGQGMMFTNAFVNIAVCQPVRQSMMTGRYPHNNGAPGFDPIDMDVPTLHEQLNRVSYLNGIMGKEKHYQPTEKYCWDYYVTEHDLASGFLPDLPYGTNIGKDNFTVFMNGREIPIFIEDGSVMVDNLNAGRYLMEIR